MACVVLHNICIELNEVDPPDDIEISVGNASIPLSISSQATHSAVRATLVNSVFC